MMDDLQAVGEFDFTAAFAYKGAGTYKDYPIPRTVRSIVLTPRNVQKISAPRFWERYHKDWRRDLDPDSFDIAVVSGYGGRTQREVLRYFHHHGIPVMMWSDSNLRSQRGRSRAARLRRWLKKQFLSRIVRHTDRMLTSNSRGVAYWRYFGVPRDRVIQCPCYSDYASIEHVRTIPRDEALRQLHLSSGSRYLFTAARLVPAKGLDQMIQAFRNGQLADRGFHYVIAGVGALEKELKSLAGDALDRSIHFLGFQQPQQNLLFMSQADLFVLPSVYEPHGIVIGESMAAGTPVLASDACGAAYDLVVPGETGDFYSSGDVKMLQAKLASLLSDPEQLTRMRLAARQKFEQWFNTTSPIKVVHEVANALLRSRGPLVSLPRST